MIIIQVHDDPLGSVFKVNSFHKSQLTGLIMNQLTLDVDPGSSKENKPPTKFQPEREQFPHSNMSAPKIIRYFYSLLSQIYIMSYLLFF